MVSLTLEGSPDTKRDNEKCGTNFECHNEFNVIMRDSGNILNELL